MVNHLLFFADLALREEEFGSIIPEYAAVIFDEAHEIEDVAGQYFGVSLSNHQIHDLARDVAAVARAKNVGSEELDEILNVAGQAAEMFFKLFGASEGRNGFREHNAFLDINGERYANLLRAVEL